MVATFPTPIRSGVSTPIHQQFTVSFQYTVHFTEALFHSDNALLAETIAADGEAGPKKIMVIVDDGAANHHPHLLSQIEHYGKCYCDALTLTAPPIRVPGGEAAKNDLNLIEQLQRQMDAVGLCRHSYVVGIGGGAVLDMVGYAAATAHRGIRLIRVPTTVLAQNDSGVGVKNSINVYGKKNFLGTFAPPYAVINDAAFLTTLDDRDWRAGMAEALKVALIKDADFFAEIEANAAAIARREMAPMQSSIYRCAQLHMHHIANNGDPFEMGSSRPLDFGHWAAHRLERLTHYHLRHGEAVAIGIVLDSAYSYLAGWLSQAAWQRICNTFRILGFTPYVLELSNHLNYPEHPDSIFRGLAEFREHLGGELTITLLHEIGFGVEVHQVDLQRYREAIALLKSLPIP
ncbi:3-dehydroquinate synthase [Oscillatoria sp. CS-180]|uniref:3-dehydroquinate synthase n=1 Tax=Oscillatoria sp. CS-180 TaxID=3021720 RepID=UPI00232EE30E|nr:3-dehydroquinate synthase [Oscillatoria sp. CS-180]MDB9528025.1 3-dehydroquinate synthase [Oscillatoria sp. CS-180]